MKTSLNWCALVIVSSCLMSAAAFAKHDEKNDKKDQVLPPGLQKKAEQGKPLPPGWQKKLNRGDILDRDIYDRGRIVMPLDRDGHISIEVDGALIKLDENSRKILDVINIVTD